MRGTHDPEQGPDPLRVRLLKRTLEASTRTTVRTLTSLTMEGLERVPRSGPLIVALNHVCNVDPMLVVAFFPRPVRFLAVSDLFSLPHASYLLRAYRAIPVNRGERDGTALRASVDALATGAAIGVAPEGRMSVTGALERARTGVGYLALVSGAPVLPVAFTGTEHLTAAARRLRRPRVTMRVGSPMRFERTTTGQIGADRLQEVTDTVMYAIAAMLPVEYRGVYAEAPTAG